MAEPPNWQAGGKNFTAVYSSDKILNGEVHKYWRNRFIRLIINFAWFHLQIFLQFYKWNFASRVHCSKILLDLLSWNDKKLSSPQKTDDCFSHFLKMRCRSKSVSRFCYLCVKLREGQIGLSCLPCLVSKKKQRNYKQQQNKNQFEKNEF